VDPPFATGHWVPDLISAADGTAGAARPGGRSVQTGWPAITTAAPDVLLVAPCGFHLYDAAAQAAELVARSVLLVVPVWAIDADGFVVRPGPRLLDGVEAIALLHSGRLPDPLPGRISRIA
jgi:iron complex transport system substrate-binding protein